jgi:hypothetical protein
VLEAEEVVSEMASANYDGIDEIYFDYAVDPGATPIGESLHVELEGHIGLGADEDRPSMGDRVWVSGSLRFERFGQRCFGALEVLVHRARLGDRWRGLDDLDHAEDGPPLVTRTNALAELLGLEPAEVGALIDVDPEAQTGSSGEMVYGYVLDFEPLASPEVAARIRARHGSLQVEVGPGYFDNVVDDDWPA